MIIGEKAKKLGIRISRIGGVFGAQFGRNLTPKGGGFSPQEGFKPELGPLMLGVLKPT